MERIMKFINNDISTSMLYAYISFSLSEELSLSPIPSDNVAELFPLFKRKIFQKKTYEQCHKSGICIEFII